MTNRFKDVQGKVRPGSATPSTPGRNTPAATAASNELKAAQMRVTDPSMKECTFQPRVRGASKGMTSARLYLQTNVVDRLTRPFTAGGGSSGSVDDSMMSPGDEQDEWGVDRPSTDASSFFNNIGGSGTRGRRPSSAPRQRSNSTSGSSVGGGDILTPEEVERRREAFRIFMARQQHTLIRKDQKIQEIMEKSTPSFKPRLSQRSLSITATTSRGSFDERLRRDAYRREAEEQRRAQMNVDPDCTFRPTMTPAASRMRSRSVHEMSRGDMLRRETTQRLLRLRCEQAELHTLTFKPEITKMAQSSQPRLRVVTSNGSEGYIEEIKMMMEMQRRKEEQAKLEAERKEVAECTFRPATKELPAYIKRISQSLRMAKAMRPPPPAASQPEWR